MSEKDTQKLKEHKKNQFCGKSQKELKRRT